jgi:hypothetical protein
MKLYGIVSENAYGQPEALVDSLSGMPEVYVQERNATKACDDYNRETEGGYFVEPFETEDD